MFSWKLMLNSLLTRPNLSRCHLVFSYSNVGGVICMEKLESRGHIYVLCGLASIIWYKVLGGCEMFGDF